MSDTQIRRAAEMAGQWWADRLSDEYANRRPALAAAVAKRVEQELRGECYWDWQGERHEGRGYEDHSRIEFDYDPHNLLIPACAEALDGIPEYKYRSAFPTKHMLDVFLDRMKPKEGYGNWTPTIPVAPAERDSEGPRGPVR